MKTAKFKIAPRKGCGFYVSLIAANGEPLMVGEGYPSRRNARRAVAAIRRAAAAAVVVEL